MLSQEKRREKEIRCVVEQTNHRLPIDQSNEYKLMNKQRKTSLLFCSTRLRLGIVESLCYPLPEHPHRQHVFSLTTRFADTFCCQVNPSAFVHWSFTFVVRLAFFKGVGSIGIGSLDSKDSFSFIIENKRIFVEKRYQRNRR